jgi:hypothetical protein
MRERQIQTTRAAPACAPERPDPLELWRLADRVARTAEIQLRNHPSAAPHDGPPAAAHAIELRRRANELLRAALGDADRQVPQLDHTAQALRR